MVSTVRDGRNECGTEYQCRILLARNTDCLLQKHCGCLWMADPLTDTCNAWVVYQVASAMNLIAFRAMVAWTGYQQHGRGGHRAYAGMMSRTSLLLCEL